MLPFHILKLEEKAAVVLFADSGLDLEGHRLKSCNGVFAGGGVRGIAHLGAVCEMEQRGYRFERLAGSSAGAIVAALVAAGYTGAEAKTAMLETDYPKFKEKDLLDYLGVLGKAIGLFWKFGIYSTDYFESWLNRLLLPKRVLVFEDVKIEGDSLGRSGASADYRLKVTASDLTDRLLLVLPDDLKDFGIDPDSFSIARAVRMSMSIPVFFEPYRLKDSRGKEHLIVDGGLLSNYPMWIMDRWKGKDSKIPAFGFRFLGAEEGSRVCGNCGGTDFTDYMKAIVSTALEAHDNLHVSHSKGYFQKTVWISPEISVDGEKRRIGATDFEITTKEQMLLYENGRMAVSEFLQSQTL